ncbi:hypothetical protein D3C80_2067130 [compost metagenome]
MGVSRLYASLPEIGCLEAAFHSLKTHSKHECGAGSLTRLNPDLPAKQLNQLLRDRQPQTCTFILSVHEIIQLMKRLE